VTATEVPVADPAPFVAALRSYAEDGLVPFSCPGHKRGQGAAGEPRALPGDEVVVGRDLHKSLLVGLILTGPDRCTWPRGPIPSSASAWGPRRQARPAAGATAPGPARTSPTTSRPSGSPAGRAPAPCRRGRGA
jgi:hypothetical protein